MRAGASRELAALLTAQAPDVLALCEIDPGDAFSIATRFALEWAYRGGQALLWSSRFTARDVHDSYLPTPSALPIDRRGFLRVDGAYDGIACSLVTTQISEVRERRIIELRFLRTQLRACAPRALLFAQVPEGRIGVRDLGFDEIASDGAQRAFARGFERETPHARCSRV
jgi:hypothetical protein